MNQAPVSKLARRDARWGGLRGNWATLLLPIDADDAIDFARLADTLDAITAARVDGVYSNGTAGECHNQTEAEFDGIQGLLADRCRAAGTRFVVGACQPDPRLALERVRRAAALRPDGIQVILPDWAPVTRPEATDFLHMAAEAAAGIPLILYNPPHAKRVFPPATLAAIMAPVPAVVGVKLGDGDAAWYAEARATLADWAVYVPGHHLASGAAEGVAAGSFSNVACLSPGGAQRWTETMATDADAALDIERRIRTFLDEHIVPFARDGGYSNGALDKLLAAIGGWAPVGTRLRRPYRSIDPAEADRLRPIARTAIPEIMEAAP
jgi:dihydrodipicolinate synthase/N-acetylneuraminate lyase